MFLIFNLKLKLFRLIHIFALPLYINKYLTFCLFDTEYYSLYSKVIKTQYYDFRNLGHRRIHKHGQRDRILIDVRIAEFQSHGIRRVIRNRRSLASNTFYSFQILPCIRVQSYTYIFFIYCGVKFRIPNTRQRSRVLTYFRP